MHVWSGIDRRRRGLTADFTPADGLLQQAVERQLRLGQERAVLALHLSQLLAPAPRPHHRRIARLVLDDTAQLHDGQVFTRANGDLVLICEPEVASGLIETLTRLFRADAPSTNQLLSVWTLPQDGKTVLAYAGQDAASPLLAAKVEPPAEASAIDTVGALITSARFSDLVRRQTAVHITGDGARLLFHEVAFSSQVLGERVAALAPAQADPFLFRYLATRFDARMLEAMYGELTRGGPMAHSSPLHLNLTLPGIHSAGFPRLVGAARARGVALGIEVSLHEACADAGSFVAASAVLRAHGCAVVLDCVTHPALLITTPEALKPDLVKLDWASRIAILPAREQRQLAAALDRLTPERIVLQRADTEGAISWGLSRGIRRFQGNYVDSMMAAYRITTCPQAAGCSFRQCIDRAAAIGDVGRSGCRNTVLLDSGLLEGEPA